MPTGYTAYVQDGVITEFADFAMKCARAFGALIDMRDESLDAEIRVQREPNTEYFDKELMDFNWTEGRLKVGDFTEPFLRGVAVPMYNAYMFKKDRNYDEALETTNYIIPDDWRIAAQEWMRRKQIAHERNTKPFTEVVETNTFNQDHDVADTFGVERSTDA